MAKNFRRMLAMVLVMCMFVSALPMQALAAEGEPVTETTTNDGVTTTTTTTTSTSTDSSGNKTETVSTQGTSSGTQTSTGATVTGSSSSVSSTTTTSDGKEVASSSNSQSSTTTTSSSTDANGTKTDVKTENNTSESSSKKGDEETSSSSSSTTTTTTTTSSSTDANGTKVDSVTENVNSQSSTTKDGEEIYNASSNVTTSTTTTTGADGSSSKKEVEEGSETTKEIVSVLPGDKFPDFEDVTLNLKPGEDVVVKLEDEAYTDKKVDVSYEGAGDKNYDYTNTTTTPGVIVTGTMEESFVILPNTSLNCPVAPEDYEGKQYYDGSNDYCDYTDKANCSTGYQNVDHYQNGLLNTSVNSHASLVGPKPDTDDYEKGYDFVWTGSGDASNGASAVLGVYKTDADGNYIIGEDGKPVIEYVKGSKAQEGMLLTPGQFALRGENGNYFYAYCIDASTGSSPELNAWYQLRNLEDIIEDPNNPEHANDPNRYITADDAALIRAIATNGYWGTNANNYNEDGTVKYINKTDANGDVIYQKDENGNLVTDEDGNYVPEQVIETDSSVRGSLASMKEMLRAAYADNKDAVITVDYPDDYKYDPDNDGQLDKTELKIWDLIDNLTEAEALACTQVALWSLTDSEGITKGNSNNASIITVLSAAKLHNNRTETNPDAWIMQYRPQHDLESDVRMKALLECLLNLTPIEAKDTNEIDIIPDENVFTDVALVVKDKVTENLDNQDNNADNDVYHTELSFQLGFAPDPENDDLLVYLYEYKTDEDGNVMKDDNGNPVTEVMKDAQGTPIVRRLAGSNAEGESYSAITCTYETVGDKQVAVYSLTNLQLSENAKFDLRLEGTQYVPEGVYIYQAAAEDGNRRKASQTLVGLVEGNQSISAGLTISFDVDERNNVVTEHVWRRDPSEEKKPTPKDPTPKTTRNVGGDPAPAPQIFRLNNQNEELVEIPEEPVPLATPVVTGDNSGLWVAVILIALCGIVAVNVFDKKRQHESF